MTLSHEIGNGVYENDEFNTGGAATIELFFQNSATDTATKRYFNLGRPAYSAQIIPSDDISISMINSRTLKSPKTVGTNGITLYKIFYLKIITTADVNLKILAKE